MANTSHDKPMNEGKVSGGFIMPDINRIPAGIMRDKPILTHF